MIMTLHKTSMGIESRGQVIAEYLVIVMLISLLTVVGMNLFRDFVTQMRRVRDVGVNLMIKR